MAFLARLREQFFPQFQFLRHVWSLFCSEGSQKNELLPPTLARLICDYSYM